MKSSLLPASHYKEFDERETKLIDTLRKFRIGIVYYGRKIEKDFLINSEDDIRKIIETLFKIVEAKTKGT